MDAYQEDGSHITKFHIWEPIGWQGVVAIMNALRTVVYPHTRSIRLWKTACEDEGVRAVCLYIAQCYSVFFLDLLDNNITKLGCQFLGKVLAPETKSNLINVKLDHNPFGSEGVKYLAEGLCMNKNITHLSMQYCSIDEKGARPLFEILIYKESALEELLLGGNHLRDEGVILVLKGASVAQKNLRYLSLADNQFLESIEVMEAVNNCMLKNQGLGKYDFRYNFTADTFVENLCKTMETATHVYDVQIDERIAKETLEMFNEKKNANKPKKGKKGKGGKKKKK